MEKWRKNREYMHHGMTSILKKGELTIEPLKAYRQWHLISPIEKALRYEYPDL